VVVDQLQSDPLKSSLHLTSRSKCCDSSKTPMCYFMIDRAEKESKLRYPTAVVGCYHVSTRRDFGSMKPRTPKTAILTSLT
jgi:hypothetical protein